MKILPVNLIREADAYTIMHEPVSDIDLMERAAGKCSAWLLGHYSEKSKWLVIAGSGNNGGDGLVIARHLLNAGHTVRVIMLASEGTLSPSCRHNLQRLAELPEKCVILWQDPDENHDTSELNIELDEILIDAVFGSGLTRPPSGFIAEVIDYVNSLTNIVISVDVPSGLYVDKSVRGKTNPVVIQADYTLTFAPAKLAFFFPENASFVGQWEMLDIGLSPEFIAGAVVKNFVLQEHEIVKMLRPRTKFSHKGSFGHALLISGSTGKTGAAVLAARACMRSGAGLVTVRIPQGGVSILQSSFPEAMVSVDPDQDRFTTLPDLTPYRAIGVGPGMGTHSSTAGALKLLIQQLRVPAVFDADALNILAENRTWLAFLPKGSILTPHPGEFERLAGKCPNDFERNQVQREMSVRFGCYIVLKGAHTAITTPHGDCYFNTTGNPGMATGGSGDVLTGIITGLLAQGFSPLEASVFGVYLHGLAGDLALSEQSPESLIAGDITHFLGKSYQHLYGKL